MPISFSVPSSLSVSGTTTTAALVVGSLTGVLTASSGVVSVGGAITTSGLTMSTAKMLGRATGGTGSVEEIVVTGSGNAVLSASPTLTGTVIAAGLTASGVVSVSNTTSATTSLLGALVVGNGTAATSVGVGGGNINAGGTGTFGGGVSIPGDLKGLKLNGGITDSYWLHYAAVSSSFPVRLAMAADAVSQRAFQIGYYVGDASAGAWTSNFSVNGYSGAVASAGIATFTDTTSATTSLLGAVVIGNGSAATSVGIGGGNINAGGTITAGTTLADQGGTLAAQRNALATAQGLVGNGTASSTATLPSVPSGNQSWPVVFAVPATNPAAVVGVLGAGGDYEAATTFSINLSAAGALEIYAFAAGAAHYRKAAISGFVAAYAGTTVVLEPTISAGVLVIYVNGIAATYAETTLGTPPAWGATLGSAVVRVGASSSSNYYYTGYIRLLGVLNYAHAAAQALALYQTGQLAAEDYGQGTNDAGVVVAASNTSLVTGNNSTFGADTGYWTNSGGGTISGGVANIAASGFLGRVGMLVPGKQYRITATVAGAALSVTNLDAATYGTLPVGTTTITLTASANTNLGFQNFTGSNANIDDLTIYCIGLLCAPEANAPGNGLEWLDVSGNRAHIVLPVSGVTWALPSSQQIVIEATTNTATNQQLAAASIIDVNKQWRIQSWTVNCSTGTPTISLGNASAGAQYVSGAVLAAGNNDITLLTRFPTTANLWCNSSTTATLIHRIVLVPAN